MTDHSFAMSFSALYSNPVVSWPAARTRSTQNKACCSTTAARTLRSNEPLVTCQPIMLEMKGPNTKPSAKAKAISFFFFPFALHGVHFTQRKLLCVGSPRAKYAGPLGLSISRAPPQPSDDPFGSGISTHQNKRQRRLPPNDERGSTLF